MPRINKAKKQPWIASRNKTKKRINQVWSKDDFYNTTEWRTLRNYFIRDNPLCVECKRKGQYKEAEVVDHITPIQQGGSKTDILNLQSLCKSCHNRKTGREGAKVTNNR